MGAVDKKDKSTGLQAIDKPVFKYWEAIYRSFYSSYLYVDVAKRWKGFGFMYLLLVFAIFSIPYALKTGLAYQTAVKQQLIEPITLLPILKVVNGKVAFDKPMPYLVKNKENQVVAVIDTTTKNPNFTQGYPFQSIFISENKATFKVPMFNFFKGEANLPAFGTPIEQSLENLNGTFNGKQFVAEGRLRSVEITVPWMIYFVIVSTCFFFSIGLYVFTSLLAQLYARLFFKIQLPFKKVCLLLIVSSTPMLLFAFLCLFLQLLFKSQGIVLLVVMVLYFTFALLSYRRESRRMLSA